MSNTHNTVFETKEKQQRFSQLAEHPVINLDLEACAYALFQNEVMYHTHQGHEYRFHITGMIRPKREKAHWCIEVTSYNGFYGLITYDHRERMGTCKTPMKMDLDLIGEHVPKDPMDVTTKDIIDAFYNDGGVIIQKDFLVPYEIWRQSQLFPWWVVNGKTPHGTNAQLVLDVDNQLCSLLLQ